MSTADEDRWDSTEGTDVYHQPFRVPELDQDTRALAIAEANRAIAAFHAQTWYQTAWARARFGLYWAGYKPRLVLATLFVRLWCFLTKADSRLVSQRVWFKLGL